MFYFSLAGLEVFPPLPDVMLTKTSCLVEGLTLWYDRVHHKQRSNKGALHES